MTAQLDLALGDGLRAQSSGPLDSSRGTSANTTPNWQLCTSTPLVKRVEGMQTVGAQVVTGSVGKFHRKCSPCHAGPAILQQACLYLVAFSGEGAPALGIVSCLDPASPRPRGPQAVPTLSLANSSEKRVWLACHPNSAAPPRLTRQHPGSHLLCARWSRMSVALSPAALLGLHPAWPSGTESGSLSCPRQ